MQTVAKQVAHGVIEIAVKGSGEFVTAPSFDPPPVATDYAVSKDAPPPPVVQNQTVTTGANSTTEK